MPSIGSSYARRLRAEELEDRRMLATFTVLNNLDSGPGSLREAISSANGSVGADTITFDSSVFAGAKTINLTSQLPTITDALTITGTGANLLIIDAGSGADNTLNTGDGYRIFDIDDGTAAEIDVEISGLTLTGGDVAVSDNDGAGGAILNRENLLLANSTLAGNSAYGGGGGLANAFGTATITGSTLSGNSTDNFGGGMVNAGTATLTGSTLSGNSARGGGGIFNSFDSTLTVTSSTLSGNLGVGDAGGIFNIGTATVTSSIVANSGSAGDLGGSFSGSFNLIGDGQNLSSLTNTVTGNPLLGPLAFNGGPTQTHALLPGSPAINTGSSTALFDQRGAPFSRDDGNGVDIGAFERQSLSPSFFVVTTVADELDYSNADVSLREAIDLANANPGADTITFDASVFNTAQTINLTSQLPTITDAVTITGTGANLLTIDAGNGADGQFNTLDGYRIFHIDDGTAAEIGVEISRLTLTGGDVAFSDNAGHGAAIFNSENLLLTNSTLSGNSASSRGGGIYNEGTVTVTDNTLSGNSAYRGGGIYNAGAVTVTSSTLSGNSAIARGGGIFNADTATVTNSTLSGNSAGSGNGLGGGIYNEGTVTVTDSTVSGNMTTVGGGIYNNGTAMVTGSTFSGNTATASGGGLTIGFGKDATITDSTFSDNSAQKFGGGIFNRGTATITGSTLSGNSADYGTSSGIAFGGGISNMGTATISNSTLSGNSADRGGGIHNQAAATVTSSTFSDNSATARGGGMYSTDTATATDSTFERNSAYRGGGISNLGTATITGSAFSYNTAIGRGGGISNMNTATVANSTFSGNTTYLGGGIYSAGMATVASSTFSGNTTTLGGGVYNNGTAMVTGSTFSGNTATASGGGLTIGFGKDATIADSTFSDNSAQKFGGGIFNLGTATITGSTLSGNSADYGTSSGIAFGGGISNMGTATISNSTLSGNSADYGGGIHNDDGVSATATVTNSIVANSTNGGDLGGFGLVSGSFNLIEDGQNLSNLTGTVTGDPLLGPLAFNGGPTQTHALLPGSPAIDAGDNSLLPADTNDLDNDQDTTESIPFDQRGAPFSRDDGNGVDIGAFERQVVVVDSGDFDADGDVDGTDFLVWQRGGSPAPLSASDLDDWQTNYGQSSAIAAASSVVSVPQPTQPGFPEIVAADLIDAAMAWDLANRVGEPSDAPAYEEKSVDEVFDAVGLRSAAIAAITSTDGEDFTAAASRDDSADDQWLADELLERAFD